MNYGCSLLLTLSARPDLSILISRVGGPSNLPLEHEVLPNDHRYLVD